EVLGQLERRLVDRFPRAIVAGSISPPFREVTDAENEAFAEQIVAARADIVWVGLGLPKQDEWLRRSAALFAPAVGLGVGAAFDFLAGTKPRAPEWAQAAGLEWLHRLMKEPRRLAGRYATTNTEFLARAGISITGEYGRAALRRVDVLAAAAAALAGGIAAISPPVALVVIGLVIVVTYLGETAHRPLGEVLIVGM